MPRVVSVVSAFTSGELSPSAYGRVDIAKYANGMSCIRNYLPDPLGGIKRRMGLRFVCESKFSQFQSRLLPFEPTSVAAYMLEVGCEYLRFYKNNAPIGGPELVTNGSFDADLSGWTVSTTGSGTVSWDASQRARLTVPLAAGGHQASIQQNVTVVAGTAYTVNFTVAGTTRLYFYAGSTTNGFDIFSAFDLAPGAYVHTLTSTTTTLSLLFFLNPTVLQAHEVYLDSVSVRLATPIEVTTPYDYGEVHDLDTLQSADEMYFLHQCHPTRKLQRYGDTCWRFNCVTFSPPPTTEYGARVESSIQAGALSGTMTVTAFNNSPAFLAADVDREIQVFSGVNAGARAGIKSVTNAMQVVVNVCVPWLTTGLQCAGTWKISGSPMTVITPDDIDPIGKPSVLTLSAAGWRVGGASAGETDVGKVALINGGGYLITCVVSTTVANSVITGIQSGTSATNANRKGEAGAWSLQESLWSCYRGYASAGDFKDDRLILSALYRFVGSKVGDYENYGQGTLDDDAIIFALNAKTITTINGIVGGADLQLFTLGGEYSVTSEGAVITPTDVLVSAETTHGSSTLTPIRIGGQTTLFVDRARKSLLEFTVPQDAVSEQYFAPDLLLLAEHLTATTQIHEFVYQRKPQPTVWVVLESGEIITCTYRREENVVAWAKHSTCGTFESIGVMPHPDGDREQVWVVVNRTINGATKRYVEYFDDSTLGPYDRRYTDASVVYACTSLTRLTGLDHLECATVQIIANGAFLCTQSVAGGQVKPSDDGSVVGPYEVGLPYVSEAITLQPEVSYGAGSIQPMAKRFGVVWCRTRDSCSMLVRTGTGAWESLPTGESIGNGVRDHRVNRRGDFFDARISLRQENPLPSHILMVGGTLQVDAE